ncbi:MAG TPA: MFS transporter, partial [Roseiflexaceae bacterium]|nr:MFS transporter [Roseiflexaceae bacterium]
RVPLLAPRFGRRLFIAGLGIGQIASWGTLYYSFPLIAERMGQDLGLSKPEVYGAATTGLLIASFTAYPVGMAIDRGYGRTVMALGSGLAGLLLMAWSQIASLLVLYPLLAGIGLAQAMTLYEPAFAVVARRYGAEARRGITALTLWGGFASTMFVPLIQVLLNAVDWRGTLMVLGAINLGLCAPLYFGVIDANADAQPPDPASVTSSAAPPTGRRAVRSALHQPAFWGLLLAFTVYYATFSGLSFHMYSLFLERGFDTATVVTVIGLIGPAQVAGRIAVWSIAERASVQTVGKVVVLAFPIAITLLLLLPPTSASLVVFAVIYGAANGILTIVRGITVPEILTREAYGAINSLLAIPATIAKAIAPLGIALLWAATGSYYSVLVAALASSTLVVGGFWFAAAKR